MANSIVPYPAPCAQPSPTSQTTECDQTFILQDGVHPYDDPEDQWVVIVDGEEVAWAADQSQAWRSYREMLTVEFGYSGRNPEDVPILVTYANGETDTWEVQNV